MPLPPAESVLSAVRDMRPKPAPPFTTWLMRSLFVINLLALLAPTYDLSWQHAMLLMPWALALTDRDVRTLTWITVKTHWPLTAVSSLFSTHIFLSCLAHQCDAQQIDAVWLPTLWIPIAAFTQYIRSKQAHLWLTAALLICALIMTCTMAWQSWVLELPRPRGLSFNVLSGPILLALLCTYGAVDASRGERLSRNTRAALLLMVLTCVAGAIISQSRTALISYLAGSITFVFSAPRQNRPRNACLAVGILAFWLLTMANRFHEGQREMDNLRQGQYTSSSLGERSDCLKWGIQHLTDAPWLGIGSNQMQERFAIRDFEWGRPDPIRTKILHLHNDYLQLAIERGIPAALLFVGTWALLILRFRSLPHTGPSLPRPWLLAWTAVFMTACLTDSYTYWVFMWAPIVTMSGIAVSLSAPPHQS